MDDNKIESEYYCEVCCSTMNSWDMWQKHISGKKHLKNINKGPISMPPQVKSVVKNIPAVIQRELEKLSVPVIGLNSIVEMNSSKSNSEPTYTCNLCQVGGDKKFVIEHVVTTMHRMNHLKNADPESYKMIESLCLMKCSRDSLAEEKAALLQQKEGCGRIEVREEVLSSKRRDFNSPERDQLEERNALRSNKWGANGLVEYPIPMGYAAQRPFLPDPEEMIQRIRFSPFHIKLDLLEELSRPEIGSDYEAKCVTHAVNVLSQHVVEFKTRHLPFELRAKVLREMLDPSASSDGFTPRSPNMFNNNFSENRWAQNTDFSMQRDPMVRDDVMSRRWYGPF